MSDNLNRGTLDFSQYDTMATEELEEILRLDTEAPEDAESDTELLLYVMEVLASRRNNSNITGNTAQQAWESFQKNYMPEDCLELESKKEQKILVAPWLRRVIATAAVVALIVIVPVTAKALGFEDIWNVIAHWAKETFSFISGENTDIREPHTISAEEFTSLQDALKKSNRDPSLVPIWIPEGFALEKVEKDVTPVQEVYRAIYINDDSRELMIQVQSYLLEDPEKIEINKNLVDIYVSTDTEFYIVCNHSQIQAVWTIDSYECFISGDISIEELKQMIESIERG